MRICFFVNLSAHENWREVLEKVEFYSVDLRLLRELGHEVIAVGAPSHLDWSADIYYSWWWGHAPYAAIPAKLRRKPLIVTGAFDYATCRDELPGLCYLDRPRWQKFILRRMLRMADANLFVSHYEYDEVTRNLLVRNPIYAPHAIDTDFYVPDTAARDGNFFFALALLSRESAIRKGLPQTIEAFAAVAEALPDTRLVIAGKPGDHLNVLRARAEALGIAHRVEFAGMISQQEKLDALRRCIAYVQPTLYEGFGLAIGEAAACGSPIISARRGAVPEVAGPDPVLVDPHNIDAIATAMKDAATHPRSKQWEMDSHQWVKQRYSLDRRRKILQDAIAAVV